MKTLTYKSLLISWSMVLFSISANAQEAYLDTNYYSKDTFLVYFSSNPDINQQYYDVLKAIWTRCPLLLINDIEAFKARTPEGDNRPQDTDDDWSDSISYFSQKNQGQYYFPLLSDDPFTENYTIHKQSSNGAFTYEIPNTVVLYNHCITIYYGNKHIMRAFHSSMIFLDDYGLIGSKKRTYELHDLSPNMCPVYIGWQLRRYSKDIILKKLTPEAIEERRTIDSLLELRNYDALRAYRQTKENQKKLCVLIQDTLYFSEISIRSYSATVYGGINKSIVNRLKAYTHPNYQVKDNLELTSIYLWHLKNKTPMYLYESSKYARTVYYDIFDIINDKNLYSTENDAYNQKVKFFKRMSEAISKTCSE